MYYSHANCNRLLLSEYLVPGNVSEEHFYKLLAISNIHSEKMARALEAFFVHGLPRREACEKFNVAQGNFSIKQRYLQWLSEAIIGIYPYYSNDIEDAR